MARIFYNQSMAKAVRELKPPVKDLQVDIMARPNYICIAVYEDNVMQYNLLKTEEIMAYLFTLRDLIKSYGTPCEIEGFKTRPTEGFVGTPL